MQKILVIDTLSGLFYAVVTNKIHQAISFLLEMITIEIIDQ